MAFFDNPLLDPGLSLHNPGAPFPGYSNNREEATEVAAVSNLLSSRSNNISSSTVNTHIECNNQTQESNNSMPAPDGYDWQTISDEVNAGDWLDNPRDFDMEDGEIQSAFESVLSEFEAEQKAQMLVSNAHNSNNDQMNGQYIAGNTSELEIPSPIFSLQGNSSLEQHDGQQQHHYERPQQHQHQHEQSGFSHQKAYNHRADGQYSDESHVCEYDHHPYGQYLNIQYDPFEHAHLYQQQARAYGEDTLNDYTRPIGHYTNGQYSEDQYVQGQSSQSQQGGQHPWYHQSTHMGPLQAPYVTTPTDGVDALPLSVKTPNSSQCASNKRKRNDFGPRIAQKKQKNQKNQKIYGSPYVSLGSSGGMTTSEPTHVRSAKPNECCTACNEAKVNKGVCIKLPDGGCKRCKDLEIACVPKFRWYPIKRKAATQGQSKKAALSAELEQLD